LRQGHRRSSNKSNHSNKKVAHLSSASKNAARRPSGRVPEQIVSKNVEPGVWEERDSRSTRRGDAKHKIAAAVEVRPWIMFFCASVEIKE